jgi:hypothetical protein
VTLGAIADHWQVYPEQFFPLGQSDAFTVPHPHCIQSSK